MEEEVARESGAALMTDQSRRIAARCWFLVETRNCYDHTQVVEDVLTTTWMQPKILTKNTQDLVVVVTPGVMRYISLTGGRKNNIINI